MAPIKPMAKRLKQLRSANGWTQQELANQAGVRRVHIARLETEKMEPKGMRQGGNDTRTTNHGDKPESAAVVSLAAGSPKESLGLTWAAANIQGWLRRIASALGGLANGASFPEDRDAWPFEVLVSALDREADRLEEIGTVINNRLRAGAA